MKVVSKILILLVLLFSTIATYSQCETYLEKANTFFAEKNYEDAKRQYSNYKECKPNATGIDTRIAECERLLKEKTNNQTNDSNSSSYNGLGTSTNSHPSGNSHFSNTSDNTTSESSNEAQKTERISGRIYISIGSFSGYKSNEVESSIMSALVEDGRFIVTKAQNLGYRNSPQPSSDTDYIVSGISDCVQRERTEYTNVPATKFTSAMRIPNTKPEVVNVIVTLTEAKTGQIVANSNYNLNNLNRISGNIFPVKFAVRDVNDDKIKIENVTGGTYFTGDVFKVFEENSNGVKAYLGTLKIGKNSSDCKITAGKKEINNRFKAGAKLIVEK